MPVPYETMQTADASSVGASSAIHIQVPSLDDTLGTLLVGTFMGLILLGVTLYQAFRYARAFPGDPLWIKILVALTVILEIISSVLNAQICYHSLVTGFFYPENLVRGLWSSNLIPLVSGITLIITQSFFARRLWILGSRYRPVVLLSCICYLAELGALIVATVDLFLTPDLQVGLALVSTTYIVPATFALAVIANLLLTTSLIYALRRKRTGFESTNAMLDVLILYTVNTGLINGVFDFVTTILAFTFPRKLIYATFALPAAKLYGITLLAALHSRRTAREKGRSKIENDASDLVFGVGVLSQAAPPAMPIGPSPRSGRMHAQQLRPASGMTAYSDVIEIEAMSQSLPLRNLPVVHGDQGIDLQLCQGIEQMKADVEHDLA